MTGKQETKKNDGPPSKYKVWVHCRNCEHEFNLEKPRGKEVTDRELCPNCGCYKAGKKKVEVPQLKIEPPFLPPPTVIVQQPPQPLYQPPPAPSPWGPPDITCDHDPAIFSSMRTSDRTPRVFETGSMKTYLPGKRDELDVRLGLG